MSVEQLVVYLLVGIFTLLQLLTGALKRRREGKLEQESAGQNAPETSEPWWEAEPETTAPGIPIEVRPPPPSPSPRRVPPSDARPGRRQPAAASRARPDAGLAAQHRAALRNRAELRRAVQLMAILGPPRSRVPDEP